MIGQKKPRNSSFNSPRTSFLSTDGDLPHIRIESLFQPDILLSFQHQATYRRRFNLEPEKLLMLAVLEDAIVCFQDNLGATCRRKQALYTDAEQWILDNDTSYLFSFENVCKRYISIPFTCGAVSCSGKNPSWADPKSQPVNTWPVNRV